MLILINIDETARCLGLSDALVMSECSQADVCTHPSLQTSSHSSSLLLITLTFPLQTKANVDVVQLLNLIWTFYQRSARPSQCELTDCQTFHLLIRSVSLDRHPHKQSHLPPRRSTRTTDIIDCIDRDEWEWFYSASQGSNLVSQYLYSCSCRPALSVSRVSGSDYLVYFKTTTFISVLQTDLNSFPIISGILKLLMWKWHFHIIYHFWPLTSNRVSLSTYFSYRVSSFTPLRKVVNTLLQSNE